MPPTVLRLDNGGDRGCMWLCVGTPRNEESCAIQGGNTCLGTGDLQGETKGFLSVTLSSGQPLKAARKGPWLVSSPGPGCSDSLTVARDCTGQDLVPAVLVDALSASGGRV